MKKITAFIAIVFMLTACNSNEIYSNRHTFSDLLWDKTSTPQFTFELKKEQHSLLNLELRLIYGYTYRNIKLNMTMVNESGTRKVLPINFKVRNEDDSFKGDVMGDFIDIEKTLIPDTLLPAGKYTVTLDQLMDKKTLPFVMEVGITVEKVQK